MNPHARLLVIATLLFSLRVCGQAVQRWWPISVLPEFQAWQGSGLPYIALLSVQLVILAVMCAVTWRIARGRLSPNRRVGRWLSIAGGIYLGGSVLRICIGLAASSAPIWFSTWIPAVFHLVLAAFVLVLAHFHLRKEMM